MSSSVASGSTITRQRKVRPTSQAGGSTLTSPQRSSHTPRVTFDEMVLQFCTAACGVPRDERVQILSRQVKILSNPILDAPSKSIRDAKQKLDSLSSVGNYGELAKEWVRDPGRLSHLADDVALDISEASTWDRRQVRGAAEVSALLAGQGQRVPTATEVHIGNSEGHVYLKTTYDLTGSRVTTSKILDELHYNIVSRKIESIVRRIY